MKLGFTGTRAGMTTQQKLEVENLLLFIRPSEVHHGDCVGADADFHDIAFSLHIPIIIHPCNLPTQRAYCKGASKVLEVKPPLDRNHKIVNVTDAMIACPKETHEVLRSGTWATIRYANRVGKKIHMVYPYK